MCDGKFAAPLSAAASAFLETKQRWLHVPCAWRMRLEVMFSVYWAFSQPVQEEIEEDGLLPHSLKEDFVAEMSPLISFLRPEFPLIPFLWLSVPQAPPVTERLAPSLALPLQPTWASACCRLSPAETHQSLIKMFGSR